MSLKEREKFEVDKEYNKAVAFNGGKDNREILKKLYRAYKDLGFYLETADLLEELQEKHSYGSLNNVGVAYDRAGENQKALEIYLRAMEKSPSSITAHNISVRYKYKNEKLHEEWLKKAFNALKYDYERGSENIYTLKSYAQYLEDYDYVAILDKKIDEDRKNRSSCSSGSNSDWLDEEEDGDYNKKNLTSIKYKDELCHNG